MRKYGVWLSLALAAVAPAWAQVTTEVTLDQDQFLAGETLLAAVRITNRSGQTLHLGAEQDWLSFSVESRDDAVVAKLGEVPVAGKFDLDSSQKATKRVDLAPYFSLGQPGRYAVTATVRIKAWDAEITSRPKEFHIIEGTKLWEQEIGIPRTGEGSNATPEVRKYTLQEANYLRGELRLYLRVTDGSGEKIFRTCAIGTLLSFSRPEAQVDKLSNLHVLYQSGAQAFSYNVFNTEGDLVTRQTYDYIQTHPRLQADAEGKISVVGGVRRVTTKDRPVPKAAAPGDEVETPKP